MSTRSRNCISPFSPDTISLSDNADDTASILPSRIDCIAVLIISFSLSFLAIGIRSRREKRIFKSSLVSDSVRRAAVSIISMSGANMLLFQPTTISLSTTPPICNSSFVAVPTASPSSVPMPCTAP